MWDGNLGAARGSGVRHSPALPSASRPGNVASTLKALHVYFFFFFLRVEGMGNTKKILSSIFLEVLFSNGVKE